jgi:plastocyanin
MSQTPRDFPKNARSLRKRSNAMYKSLMFSIAALGLCAAQVASATEYDIQIEEGAFYPEITYLVPGDSVKFVNNNGGTVKVVSGDSTWDSGDLGIGQSYLLAVSPETALGFSLAADSEISGQLSFDLAPLSLDDAAFEENGEGTAPESSN